jgi:hypothetical protein
MALQVLQGIGTQFVIVCVSISNNEHENNAQVVKFGARSAGSRRRTRRKNFPFWSRCRANWQAVGARIRKSACVIAGALLGQLTQSGPNLFPGDLIGCPF